MRQIRELLQEYEAYKPRRTARSDFDSFWDQALDQLQEIQLDEKVKEMNYPIKQVRCLQISYKGTYGTRINGVFITPRLKQEKLKCLIFYHGYNGNIGALSQYMQWLIQDYAVLAVDCRGMGETGDDSLYSGGNLGSWATQGLMDKKEYYYYKVFLDSKRAIDFAMARPEIDPKKICLVGSSLGGGIAVSVAALDSRPSLVVADVPNMCDLQLAIQQKTEGSLVYVESYLARYPERSEQIFENLSYFDNINFAPKIKSKIRISVALKDAVCPPKTVYGMYNHLQAEKSILVYPFSTHNAPGCADHMNQTLAYINENL